MSLLVAGYPGLGQLGVRQMKLGLERGLESVVWELALVWLAPLCSPVALGVECELLASSAPGTVHSWQILSTEQVNVTGRRAW